MSRNRNYVFTHNNYADTTLEDGIVCDYIIYGYEVGESGTPHLQGFIRFANARTLKQVIALMPGCHIEIAKTVEDAIKYCKKEGNFKERGTPPMTQKEKGVKGAEYWTEQMRLIKGDRLGEVDPKLMITHYNTIQRIRDDEKSKEELKDTESKHLWYYGTSGTGKSRKARSENPKAYLKMCNKWWDFYCDENIVLIEDFDKSHSVLLHHIKIWADRYPFLAEIKGGAKKIRPGQIIITSNWHPKEIWPAAADQRDLEAILRRFHITHFGGFSSLNTSSVMNPEYMEEERKDNELPPAPPVLVRSNAMPRVDLYDFREKVMEDNAEWCRQVIDLSEESEMEI